MPQEQVILITGCSSGIGRATSLLAAQRGHRVFASARERTSVRQLESHDRIRTLGLDVTDVASIQESVHSVIVQAGRLDALVNNAGYGQYGSIEDVSSEQWREQFAVNLFGAVEVIRAVLPAMRKARHGTIVNISSVAGKISIPFAAPYCSSKHAIEAISDALRVEVAPFGIRVVVIEPGPIATKFSERARRDVADLLSRPGPYRSFYGDAEKAMDTDFRRGQLPAEAVARVILSAIETERPKTRYRVTSMAKVFLPLRRVLPDRFLDRRMKKLLKLPDRVS